MNMAYNEYDGQEFDYSAEIGRGKGPARGGKDKAPTASAKNRFSYARGSRPAVSYNGIHRRRNKRFSW